MNTKTMASAPTYAPTSAEEVQQLVMTLPKVLPQGAQTKPTLLHISTGQEAARLDMTAISGMIEYDPGEYTFTAYAGTTLATIAATLAGHGQYMPFDPPLVATGATLGGTIAAGISGSGRHRYGGLRDFILGVQFVDGQGRFVRGGGKVVKNAAGFDTPKLMVGSLGRLGILISVSFKVFPAPRATATLRANLPTLSDALSAMNRLMSGPYDLESLDLHPNLSGSVTLLARIGGPADVLEARLERLRTVVGKGEFDLTDADIWADSLEFKWVAARHLLVKAAITPNILPDLDRALTESGAPRRYAVGGNLAWIAWPGSVDSLDQLLARLQLQGLILRGESPRALIGAPQQMEFLRRIRAALDPNRHFVDFY